MLLDMRRFGSHDNYIQMHRQRAGLSQSELAFLLSLERAASVSRLEVGARLPRLDTLLALEIVFGEPLQELFAGVAERVRADVVSRARTLLESMRIDLRR